VPTAPGLPSLKGVQIRPVDVHDDAELARFHAIIEAADRFERPYAPPWTYRELAVELRRPVPGERLTAWAAFDDQEMIGAAWAYDSLLDNTDKCWLQVSVEPQRRCRGIGSALARFLVQRCADVGRGVLLAETAYPFEAAADHPYRRFAETHGFALASTEVHRVLDLPLDGTLLEALAAEATPHHPAYRVRTLTGVVPATLLPSLCALRNQLAVDAPTGDIDYEAEAETPEVYLERDARLREQGRVRLTTVALDGAGQVVGYTDLSISLDEPGHAHQWGTMVHRDHRGHRLGMAIKVRNLQALQVAHPGVEMVHTGNADVNAHMIAINEALGFRAVEALPEFQRKLAR